MSPSIRSVADRSRGLMVPGQPLSESTAADDGREARLLGEVRNGNTEAFGSLYETHHDAVRCLARRLARDRDEADDIVSEVFCNTLRAIRNGGGPHDDTRAYLLRSVRHTVINMRTRKDTGRATPVAVDELDRPDTHDPYPVPGPATDAYLDVTDRFREVLWSTEIDGACTAEVAEAHDISGPAAASLAYRARRALRRSYLRGHIRAPIVCDECRSIRALLPAFVDGDTATPGADRVRTHLAECATCEDVRVELSSIHDRLSNRTLFLLSAGALRWLTADGGRALVAVIGTSPAVVAAGLGAGVLLHGDSAPERTEAARAVEPVVIAPEAPTDPASTDPATPSATSAVPDVVRPPQPPATGSTAVPTTSGAAVPSTASPPTTVVIEPTLTVVPVPGEAVEALPGVVDSVVTGVGGVVQPSVGGVTETVGATATTVLEVVEQTVGGVTDAVDATVTPVLEVVEVVEVVEPTAGAVVEAPSTVTGILVPIIVGG